MGSWEPDRSVPEVLQNIFGNVQEIIRSEFRLAKAEVGEEARKAGSAAGMLGAAALAVVYSGALLLVTCVLALSRALPCWLAALIVGIASGIAAAVLLNIGRRQLRALNAKPQRTIDSIKGNITWARDQTR